MSFDFTIPEHYERGILSGDDLVFFYYDIGIDHLSGWPSVYEWSSVVNKYRNDLDVEACDSNLIPEKFEDNKIRFNVSDSTDSDNNSEAAAFFRHLRNAFSHYRISRDKEWFDILDKSKGKITMRGRVKADLLKSFCFEFFNFRESLLTSQSQI